MMALYIFFLSFSQIKVRVEQQPILRVQGARGDDEHQTTPQEETRLGVQHRLLLIPIMFIVLRMWGTIQFFFSLVATGHGKCVSNSVNTVFIFLGVLQVCIIIRVSMYKDGGVKGHKTKLQFPFKLL